MAKKYRSRIMAAVHETAEDLHNTGLMDKRTMRKFDAACLMLNAALDEIESGNATPVEEDWDDG